MNYLYFSVNLDPAGQFANPYSYGGDPVNGIDPDGRSVLHLGALVTGFPLVGGLSTYLAYQGGSSANGGEVNPNYWDNNRETSMSMGKGCAVGLAMSAAAGAGAWAGGLAGTWAIGYFGLTSGGLQELLLEA